MSFLPVFLGLLAAYIIIGTWIAVVSRRFGVKSTADYFVAGYRLGGFLSSMTYAATTYSAFMMVGLVGLAYATGVASLGFELAYMVATLGLLALVGPRVWKLARDRGWVSPSEMLSDLYGSELIGVLAAGMYLVALVPYTAAQLKGIGEIFRVAGAGYEVGVLVAAALVLIWVVLAGIWSVASTDAYQGLWMIAASASVVLWLALWLLPGAGLDAGRLVEALNNTSSGNLLSNKWPLAVFVGYTVPWLFFAITNPQVVQRLYMPRNSKAYRRMVEYFALYGVLYTLIVVFIGLSFRAFAASALGRGTETELLKHRDMVTPYMMSLANPALASFVYVSIVAAAVSTANSIVLSVASSIVRDFYERRSRSPSQSTAKAIAAVSVLLMTAAAVFIALARPAFIVELSVLSSALLLPIAPVTLLGLYFRPGSKAAAAAIIALVGGFLTVLSSAFTLGAAKTLTYTVLGAPLPLWVLVATTLVSSAPILAKRAA